MSINILFYTETTSKQHYNTGIQVITRNLSKYLSNNFNLFLIKLDNNNNNNNFVLLDKEETNIFSKYNGFNQFEINYQEKIDLFNQIKNNKNNIFILSELFYFDKWEKFQTVMNIVKTNEFKSYSIYYDDIIYYKNPDLLDKYIYIQSQFDFVFPISEYSKSTYLFHLNRLNIYSKQKINTIVLPGEFLNINRQIEYLKFDNYIFSNSSFISRKNLINLIKSFNRIVQKDIKLIIAGNKYDETEYFKSIEPFLNDNIIILENVTDEKLIELYKNCIFSVYPTLIEGFGLPIYYSIWNGRPVICHNQTSTKEITEFINNEWVVNTDCSNENLLYDEMQKFIDLLYNQNIKPFSIYSIGIKCWDKYYKEFINYFTDNKIFICNEVLKNPCYSNRGVGTFVKEIINNYEKKNVIDHFYKDEYEYNTVIFTHPPPMKNSMNFHEEQTMILLKKICNKQSKKIVIIYDLIPHIFKDHYHPETVYYEYFNYLKTYFHLIITISNSTKNDLIKYLGFHKDKIIVYYPTVLIHQLSNVSEETIFVKYNLTKKDYIISPLGCDFRKNILNTIDSYLLLNNCEIKLVFMFQINQEQRNYYFNYIREKNLNKGLNIIFTGFVSDIEYILLMKNALVTFFPSLYEGFGYCISESINLNVPVITSNNSSMDELSKNSNDCIITCDPNDIYDMSLKLNWFLNNSENIKCSKNLLTYFKNNNDFYNDIFNLRIKDYNPIEFKNAINSPYLTNKIVKLDKKLQNKVKYYDKKLSNFKFSQLLNIFDINIQIRISLTGGISGIVTDCAYLNKWIITTNDLKINCNLENYEKCIISKTYHNEDWISGEIDGGGYSQKELEEIVDKIINNYNDIKKQKHCNHTNQYLDELLKDYSIKFIENLNLTFEDKICFVTPYGSDKSGISDFSFRTISELTKYMKNIDIYTDGTITKRINGVNYFKIDDILENNKDYTKIIWVIGNSDFHNKMIIYGSKLGGCFLIHDESLYELYKWNNWIPHDYSDISCFKLREIGITNKYLCFHDLVNKPDNQIIVHNKQLCENIKNVYNFHSVFVIKFPNYNFSINDKLLDFEVNDLLNLNKININNSLKLNNFNWQEYVSLYPDLKFIDNEEDALHHWHNFGKNEQRIYNWQEYVSLYPDLKLINNEQYALHHWENFGKNEGRSTSSNKKINILVAGGISEIKCINYCIKIFELLNNKNIDTYLYFVYGGTN